ncbi:DUF4249 family protein [uncultured Polaribacter sp.]|uniref:DUF4249 family protein n=1 Tax=uncultured Polaribacter sp. TaxID=174711 RepID=UPI002616DBAC|nr:DUF4249 family protein [uncultured Polaribacter sp.]
MKKLYIIPLLLIFVFSSCEKVVEVDLPSIAPKLVVDATFEVYFDEDPVTADTSVKLTLTTDFFDENIPPLNSATVFVTNLVDNSVINYTNVDDNGFYNATTNFIPEDDVAYELTIIYNNETYKSIPTKKIKSAPITNIFQTSRLFFVDEVIELQISFDDVADEDSFYLFNLSGGEFSLVSDRLFTNGSTITISEFYDPEDFDLPETILLKMSGIDVAYFNYFRILSSQGGTGGGGPFETVPSTLLGNILNKTTDANFPLGYFHISETNTVSVTLNEIEN